MRMDILLQLLLIAFFIFLNGFFVLSEFALVGVRKTRMEELARRGHKSAQRVLSALNNLPTYFSATQVGITIASLALGWLGEPALAKVFTVLLEPHLPSHILFISSHAIAITLSFLLITYLQIIFGELAPKTTALQQSEKLVFLIITPLIIFTTIFKPFVWLLRISSVALLQILHISSSGKKSVHTEEEIKLILAQSAKSGEIDAHEVEMINRVFQIGDLPIQLIMIPIHDVIAFNEMDSIKHIAASIREENMHTRFPVYEYSKKNIVGYIGMIDIYIVANELMGDKQLKDTQLIQPITKVEETTRIDDVLVLMKKKGMHLGVVVNKKQETVGIVSIEDIIESLVGEIKEK